MEALEERTLLAVALLSAYNGLDFNASGGYIPPDTAGAAGPTSYVETVNQTIGLYLSKATGTPALRSPLSTFFFTQGNLPRASAGSGLSDPIVVWDDQIQRFIVGDQDVDFGSAHVSTFDIAVSKTSSPATLTTADWSFYVVSTTENTSASNQFDADYPGNFGYNKDAFVFTLNMFPAGSTSKSLFHVQVGSVNISDLIAGVPQASLRSYSNDVAAASLRPTVMHDSVAGDPMWFVSENDGSTKIDVVKMTNVLSSTAVFATTTLAVNPYSTTVYPLQPDGTNTVTNIDSRILKAAEANNTIVATHSVSVSGTEDDARWYTIDVSTGTPTLKDQGNVSAGPNTYIYYPGIDINSSSTIGMSYMQSGTAPGQFMSVYVTGRKAIDPVGTMETPVLAQAGLKNYADFGAPTGGGRAGDLSGISVDTDGSFWIANEYANGLATNNWGTTIAHFAVPTVSADLVLTGVAPITIVEGKNLTYALTVRNLGPNTATSTVLTDVLPAGVTFVSANFGLGTSYTLVGGTLTVRLGDLAGGALVSGTIVVTSDEGNVTNQPSVTSTIFDPTLNNNKLSFSTTVTDAALTLKPASFTPTEGQAFSGVVATFTDANPLGTIDDFTVNVDWGDGNSSTGVVTQDPVTKVFTITAGNTYAEESLVNKPYLVTVTLTDVGGAAPLPLTEAVPVADAALTAGASQSVTAVEGALGTFTVATFTDADPGAKAGIFSGTIDWGDGSTSPATFLSAGGGSFNVQGKHKYLDETAIAYNVGVTIKDDGGATTSATALVTVGDALLTSTGTNLAAIEGQALPGTTAVATFKDANAFAQSTDFTATIDFGDGVNTAVPGTVTGPDVNGVFTVSAATTYLDEGGHNIKVSIADIGGATTQAQSTATISDAALTGLGTVLTSVEGVALNNVVVATFTDANPGATPADFTTGGGLVTIVWGDGNISRTTDAINPVQVVSSGGGKFAVLGSNTYKLAQGYPITVTILDDGGQSTTATSAATITPAPLVPGPSVPIAAVEGVPFSGPIGSFTSANPFAVASSFFATIQWGDGTSTNATITTPGLNAPFSVADASGGHQYPEESPAGQTYPISIIVSGTGGQRITLSNTAAVRDAALTASLNQPVLQPIGPPPFLEGKTFSGVVATFTDANANAPLSDFAATIVWGDGHNSAGTVAYDAVNKVYTVSGANTYADEGTFTLAIVVKDKGGSQTPQIPNQIIVTDAPIQAVANAIAPIAGAGFSGQVATLTDLNPFAFLNDYATGTGGATINWGDGNSSPGVVTQPGGVGAPFVISGAHVYANPAAAISFSVTITDKGGQATTVSSTAHVLRPLQGSLDPSSDSGVSNSDGTTNVNRPLYSGTADPGVSLALLVDGIAVNQTVADSSGNWRMTTNVLADGRYSLSVLTYNATGVLQVVSLATLTVDTTPPTVAGVVFNPGARQLQIILQDNLSGLNLASLTNKDNYQFGLVARSGAVQRFTPTTLSLSPGAPGSGQEVVTLSYAFPRRVKPGAYVVTIVTNPITDVAGNTLVETNLVTFPQTTNAPNPNYVAEIDVSRGGSASSPHLYIPLAERRAANNFAQGVRRRLKFTPH